MQYISTEEANVLSQTKHKKRVMVILSTHYIFKVFDEYLFSDSQNFQLDWSTLLAQIMMCNDTIQ